MDVKEVIKETIISWSKAVELHNSGRYTEAAECYSEITDISARMRYNQACANIKLGNTDNAIESLSRAIEKDEHLAIAYFQRGTLYLQSNSTMKAIADLEMVRTLLRGNTYIDYKPLGLYTTLSSYQILQNLALAYVNAERLEDARSSMTDALHDADVSQRKNITLSLERINDSRTDLIPVMQVSVDKVFTPPKSVTKNLEKKGIVRKAKVVSATNTDDTSATFEGSKRVRELKQLQKPPTSPFNPFQRFVKNQPQPNHSASDLNEFHETKGMKASKSMSDLRTDDSSFSVGSRSPIVRIRRLFQKRTPSSAAKVTSPGIRLNHSTSELNGYLSPTAENTGRISPRTAFAGVRKRLNNKQKNQTSVPSCDNVPVLMMRGSKSTGDIRKLDTLPLKRGSEADLPQSSYIRSKSLSYEKLNFDHRNSLGSACGDYFSIVNRGLSWSCEILTALVTPIEYENDVTNVDQGRASVSIGCKESPGENKSDNPVTFYINTIPDTDVTADKSKAIITDKENADKKSSETRKLRPPPPSYPPPPLPPNIVINV